MSRALREAVHPESPADARTDGQATPEVRRREGADPRRWRALAVTQLAAFMVLLRCQHCQRRTALHRA